VTLDIWTVYGTDLLGGRLVDELINWKTNEPLKLDILLYKTCISKIKILETR